MLFGRFDGSCYSFLSIMYIPLIPTGRYHFLENRKMIQIDTLSTKKGGDISYHCWKFKKLDWAEAQYQMGFFYDCGIGIRSDKDEALKWYSKAAEQGYADAIEELKKLE